MLAVQPITETVMTLDVGHAVSVLAPGVGFTIGALVAVRAALAAWHERKRYEMRVARIEARIERARKS